MFVRWQKRKRISPAFGGFGHQIEDAAARYKFVNTRRATNEQDVHWAVILVESVRVDGKPRQRHVAYVGGITESAIEIDIQRCHFWDQISARLDALGNQMTTADREKIEAAIAEKVPRPTPDQYKDAARSSARFLGWKWLTEPQRVALQYEAELYQGDGEASQLVGSINRALTGSDIRCLFCGKTSEQVHTLVEVEGNHICDECIERAAVIIAERKQAKPET